MNDNRIKPTTPTRVEVTLYWGNGFRWGEAPPTMEAYTFTLLTEKWKGRIKVSMVTVSKPTPSLTTHDKQVLTRMLEQRVGKHYGGNILVSHIEPDLMEEVWKP